MSDGAHDFGGLAAAGAGGIGGVYSWLQTGSGIRELAKFVIGAVIVGYATWAVADWQFPKIPLPVITSAAGIAGISAVYLLHRIELRVKRVAEAVGNGAERVIEKTLGVDIGPNTPDAGANSMAGAPGVGRVCDPVDPGLLGGKQ